MIYGYCRVSTQRQRITRQVSNITKLYPTATIIKEYYTGLTQQRPMWTKLLKRLEPGDILVMDSVSRMARKASEGVSDYKTLFEKGIELIFLNEPLINSSVYAQTRSKLLNVSIETGNTAVDDFMNGNIELINRLIMSLAESQIEASFLQSEKEVMDLHSRISQGMREARYSGSQIGLKKGTRLTTKKSMDAKAIIKKHSKDFFGSLEDPDVIKLCGISRNSFYKYKREIKDEAER